jgi:DNA-binding MarR family transcriptional regulator
MKRDADIIGSPLELFTRTMFTEVIRGLSAFLARSEFSISEIAALHVIERDGPLSLRSVAALLQLSVSATSRLISGLEVREFLICKEDPKDSRVKLLVSSPAGKQLLDKLSVERVNAAHHVIQSLPATASKQLMSVINRKKPGVRR